MHKNGLFLPPSGENTASRKRDFYAFSDRFQLQQEIWLSWWPRSRRGGRWIFWEPWLGLRLGILKNSCLRCMRSHLIDVLKIIHQHPPLWPDQLECFYAHTFWPLMSLLFKTWKIKDDIGSNNFSQALNEPTHLQLCRCCGSRAARRGAPFSQEFIFSDLRRNCQ